MRIHLKPWIMSIMWTSTGCLFLVVVQWIPRIWFSQIFFSTNKAFHCPQLVVLALQKLAMISITQFALTCTNYVVCVLWFGRVMDSGKILQYCPMFVWFGIHAWSEFVV